MSRIASLETLAAKPLLGIVARSVGQLVLPLLSGALVAATFPPFELWWLAWVALVPLGLSVVMSKRMLEPIIGGLVGGATLHLLALDWIRTCFESSGISGPWAFAWLGTAIAASPTWCLTVAVTHVLYHRWATSAAIALSIGWIAGDLARRAMALVFTEMDFPWLQLAAPQTHWPVVVQAADIFGATGVSGFVALVNGGVCDAILSRGYRAKARALGVTFIVVVFVLAYGAWRLSQPLSGLGPRVALMAAHYRLGTSGDPALLSGNADILLWPEGAIQDDNLTDAERIEQIEGVAREVNRLVAIGWYRNRPTFTSNSIVVAHPRDGLVQVYEKTYLVPWTEFTPTVTIPFIPKPDRPYRRNSEHRTFACANVRVAPAICYDACFPGLFRGFDAPDMFLVCSAEAADKRLLMREHILQMVRLRAIEFRRPIVRNVRDGHSGIIDSCGRVLVDITNLEEPTVVGPVPLDERRSVYSATGDWILAVPLLAVVVVCYYRNRRMRRTAGLTNGSRPL